MCSLLLAFSSRAQRLGELFARWRSRPGKRSPSGFGWRPSRSSVRSGVRTVVVFSVAFAALLALFTQGYLAPFGSASGQLVLLAVGGLYTRRASS